MHILYLHQYFSTPSVSGGIRSFDFAKRWFERGHRVTVLTSSAHIGDSNCKTSKKRINTFNVEGIDVIVISVKYSQQMSYLRRIIAFVIFLVRASVFLAKKADYDLVFASSTPLTIAVPALVARFVNRIPFIFEVRDLWPEYPEDFGIIKNRLIIRILENFCMYVYRKADHIITVSNSMAARLMGKYGINKEKVSVIPIGACNHMLEYLDYGKVRAYKDLYGLEGKFVIGYAGTIGYVNNLDSVLSMAESLREFDDIIFLIAGNGKERRRLEEEAFKRHLYQIKFIGEFPYTEILNIIETFNAAYISERPFDDKGKKFINAEDTLSNKFFDYIMLGKPVLINAEGEISRLVGKYRCGFYVKDGDSESLKKIIFRLKENNGLKEKMGLNAKKLAGRFDRYALADRLESIFKKLISYYV